MLECEETYGKFNAERPSRRTQRRRIENGKSRMDLRTVDGNDRSSFLERNPVDLLTWYVPAILIISFIVLIIVYSRAKISISFVIRWHLMDKYNLLFHHGKDG